MYKYENIKKVLSYVPSGLLEEENEATLIKWALQFYNQNIRIKTLTDDILFCVMQVTNHKATMPVGFKQFIEVNFNETLPENEFDDSTTWFLQEDINGIHTTIFQRTFWQYFKNRSQAMRYAGKDSSIVHNDCVQYLCENCINFSIDNHNQTMTLDVEDGYVFMLYTSTMVDDDNNFLVPDNNILWQALSYGIEAKHWQDRAFRKEEGANNMFIERMRMANNSIQEFIKIHLFNNFDPDLNVSRMQKVNHATQIAYQNDRTNYKR